MKLVKLLHEVLLLREAPEDDIAGIIDLPIDDFVAKFKELATDPKVKAILNAGKRDGEPTDEMISYNTKAISVYDLMPTQNEIGHYESLVSILTNKHNSIESIIKDTIAMPPIVTFNGKYIIDGHHRWSQVYVVNPNANIDCINFKASWIKPDQLLKIMHLSIAADLGTLPLSTTKGVNMLKATEKDILETVDTHLTDASLKIYTRYNLGSTKEAVAAYIWKNVKLLQRHNKPIATAASRSSMPQLGDAKKAPTLIRKGVINFINPQPDDAN